MAQVPKKGDESRKKPGETPKKRQTSSRSVEGGARYEKVNLPEDVKGRRETQGKMGKDYSEGETRGQKGSMEAQSEPRKRSGEPEIGRRSGKRGYEEFGRESDEGHRKDIEKQAGPRRWEKDLSEETQDIEEVDLSESEGEDEF